MWVAHAVVCRGLFVCCLLNVSATCECIDLRDGSAQTIYVLPHWDRSCRSNFPSHTLTVYWHRADQSQRWSCNARRLVGQPLEGQFWSHWYDSIPEKSRRKRDSNPGSSALEADAITTRPTRLLSVSGFFRSPFSLCLRLIQSLLASGSLPVSVFLQICFSSLQCLSLGSRGT